MITVIGLDGSPFTGPAAAALEPAGLVAGASRQLAAVPVPAGARTVVMGNVTSALTAVTDWDRSGGRAVVLASGDPGFFEKFVNNEFEVIVFVYEVEPAGF